MTTTQTETTLIARTATIGELTEMVAQARANMEAAWTTQSLTTCDEGYTIPQANEAIWQAREAEAIYVNLYEQLEVRLAALAAAAQPARRSRLTGTALPIKQNCFRAEGMEPFANWMYNRKTEH
jgi:hypothetical protein